MSYYGRMYILWHTILSVIDPLGAVIGAGIGSKYLHITIGCTDVSMLLGSI